MIPDLTESSDDDEFETYICGECGKVFNNEVEVNTHMTNVHKEKKQKETGHSAGDHKCTECNYRTNFAIHYYQHCLDHHTPKELEPIIFNEKPIKKPIIFILAEHNMALAQETKRLRKDLDYIKKVLKPKGPSTKFSCQKCNDLSSSPTRIQELILEDHCCKYCEKTFSSKIEKEHHKKYMCTVCQKTFSHNLELYIHTKTYHKRNNVCQPPQKKDVPKVATQIKHDLPFKCTECNYQHENREELIKHIEIKHASILIPAKVNRPVPAPREKIFKCTECNHTERSETDVIRHIESAHATILSPHKINNKSTPQKPEPENQIHTLVKCKKCNHSATNTKNLNHHINVEHSRYSNIPN